MKLLKLKTLKEEEDDRKKYPHIFVNRKDNSACIEYMTRFAKTEYPRWQEEPRVVNESTADECLRRLDMSRYLRSIKIFLSNLFKTLTKKILN